MKAKTLFLSALAIAGLAAANAQETTTPVGYEQLNIRASSFNYLGIRFHQPILASGDSMSAISSTQVQDTGIDFSSVSTPSTIYILEVLDGSGTITEFDGSAVSGDTIGVADDLQFLGTFSYQIRAAATLASVFGENNSAGLSAGFFGPTGADVVYVPNGAGGFDQYYYDSGSSSWIDNSNSSTVTASNIPLVYADGVVIAASSNAPASITVSGELKKGATSVPLLVGFNYLSSVAPAGSTLSTLFDSSQLEPGFFGPTGADVVYIPDGSGNFNKYYYDSGAGSWANADTAASVDGTSIAIDSSGVLVSAVNSKNITLGVPSTYSGL